MHRTLAQLLLIGSGWFAATLWCPIASADDIIVVSTIRPVLPESTHTVSKMGTRLYRPVFRVPKGTLILPPPPVWERTSPSGWKGSAPPQAFRSPEAPAAKASAPTRGPGRTPAWPPWPRDVFRWSR